MDGFRRTCSRRRKSPASRCSSMRPSGCARNESPAERGRPWRKRNARSSPARSRSGSGTNRSTESTSETPGSSISRSTRGTGPRTRSSRRSPRGWGDERPRRPPRGARLEVRNETRGPVDLADATQALEAVLEGDKEYVGVMQLHQDVDERRVRSMMGRFVGEIYQIPPIRSAVKREQRTRHVYELEPLEVDGRNVLFRVRCESGTYIRTLCADIGDALGVGANLVDLRRTRAATFGETDAHPLNAFRDALAYWKEDGDDTPVRAILRPVEDLLRHLPRIVVKDTAVDAICHGANLAVAGVAKLSDHIRVGDLVGVYTGKGEAVAIAKALMTSDRIVIEKSGAAADTDRVLMAPGTYPRLWK